MKKYVLEIMLGVSNWRDIPGGWHCASSAKPLKGSRVVPEKQESLTTEYHVTKTHNTQGDL